MGAGVSGQPVYLTRSTMLISHTPMTQPPVPQCTFRRQSTVLTAPGSSGGGGGGISSQLTLPIQFYPNNVYQNNGYSAQVHGFEPPSQASTTSTAPSAPPPPPPTEPSEETPPAYSSIYPDLARRTI